MEFNYFVRRQAFRLHAQNSGEDQVSNEGEAFWSEHKVSPELTTMTAISAGRFSDDDQQQLANDGTIPTSVQLDDRHHRHCQQKKMENP